MLIDWLSSKFGRARVFMALGSVVAACSCSVLVLFGMLLNSSIASASVGPRPTVELVKVFECRLLNRATLCGDEIETMANIWLQDKQQGIRVTARQIAVNEDHVYLVIFYEVPEWRVTGRPTQKPERKLPAEEP